jgi:hypothetical protein
MAYLSSYAWAHVEHAPGRGVGLVEPRAGTGQLLALSAVRVWLAARLKGQDNTGRDPWRAWGDEAPAKRGAQRQARAVDDDVGPRLGWVRRGGPGPQLAWGLAASQGLADPEGQSHVAA